MNKDCSDYYGKEAREKEMSYSVCFKCYGMVSGYEKYCDSCQTKHNLRNDEDYWKRKSSYPIPSIEVREAQWKKDVLGGQNAN